MMEARARSRRQPYPVQSLWLRPRWWLWMGGCALLILALSLGAPLLCVVHCALVDAQLHLQHAGGDLGPYERSCADQHIPLQVSFPAILVTPLLITICPISRRVRSTVILHLVPRTVAPPVPPPRVVI